MRIRRLCLVGLLLFLAVPAFAQRFTATLRGTVTDPTHAVIANAKVTVKGEATGLTRSMATNSSGAYSFPDLPVGSYQLTVEAPGFKIAVKSKLELNVADTRVSDVQLETGAVTETVTVEANTLAVKTVGGEVAGLVTGEQVRELPLNGRNFLQLALLMPGVSAPDFLNVKDKGLLGGSDISVSGSAVTSNLWTVDGANNNDVGSNRTILVYPSVDAIEEFKIHRNDYGAEFGQAGGAQVNIVTRGGTNEFHGSAFYFGRNDALNATNYFLEQAHQPKNKLSRNDFGWTFGGPIVKDKFHFFASQEWNLETRGSVRTSFVPTSAERNGDFSGPAIEGCTSPTPTDPLTGEPFPGNKIPANRLNQAGLLFWQLYPLPNTTPPAGSCNNWVTSLDTPIYWRQENARLDWTISSSSHLMVRYTQDTWTNDAPNLQSNLWGDDPFPAVDSNWDQPGRSLVAQLSTNIGSKAVNNLTFSYSANKITVTRGGSGINGMTAQEFNSALNAAIPSLFPDSIHEYGADRGHPLLWGSEGYSDLWNEAPFRNNQNLFVLKDDYSAVFGTHFFKAGVLASYNQKNEDTQGFGSSEAPQFWGGAGFNGTGATTGNLLADFLLKDMALGFSEISSQRQNPQRWKDLEFYVTDSWRVHPRLTVDAGVRYSLLFNPYTEDNKIASFNPALFNPALGGDPCNGLVIPPGTNWCQEAGFSPGTQGPNRSLGDENYTMIAPRIGIAWDVSGTGKTAIRVGLGRFFERERLSGGLALGANPPFQFVSSGSRFLDSTVPPCPDCFTSSFGAPANGRDPQGLTPNEWQWNLSFEHEIARNTTIELSYVGSKGNHLLRFYDANQVAAGDVNGNGIPDRLEYARTEDALTEVRPYGAFGDSGITIWGHTGSSKYHSLQAQFLSRFGHGSQFQASYTWSKSIADVPLDDSGGRSSDNSITDLGNPGLDRGPTRTNRPHIFNASLVLALPSFEEKSGFVKHVFGDWEVAGIAAAASGQSVTVYTGSIPGLNRGPSGTGDTDNQRPNRVVGVSCRASGGLKEQIINPDAFTLTGFQLGAIGDAGRGICEGPNLFQVDLALYKNIRLSDRFKAQLRFEVFNLFNRVNFLAGSLETTMSPTDATFDTGDPATATKITGYALPASFGQASGTRDERQIQLGIKLTF